MHLRLLRAVALLASLASAGGCALLANSTTQFVDVTSAPSGAQVRVDGRPVGETPVRVKLPRRRGGVVLRFEKDGFRSQQRPLRRSLSRWLWGDAYVLARLPVNDYTWGMWVGYNAIVWGLDFATGAAFTFPSRVEAELIPAGTEGAAELRQAAPPGRRLSSRLLAAATRSAAARFQAHLDARLNHRRTAEGRAR